MFSNKPWYEPFLSQYKLKESDFILSKKETNKFLSFYKKLINFEDEDYNYLFIKERFCFVDFLEFNYEDESIMEGYVSDILFDSKELYVAPVIFAAEDLNSILFDFKPSAIAKIKSNIDNYKRIFGSMISDYSGCFLVTPNDFSYVLIVKNGHYALRLHRKNIYINKWKELYLRKIEMYEYDIMEILKFISLQTLK